MKWLRSSFVGAIAFALAILLAWQFAADRNIISPVFFPSPSRTLAELWRQISEGSLAVRTTCRTGMRRIRDHENTRTLHVEMPQVVQRPMGLLVPLIEEWSQEYDRILFDTPPIIAVADPVILASKCDQSLLVVQAHQTPRETMQRALVALTTVHASVIGVLFNAVDVKRGYGYVYSCYY